MIILKHGSENSLDDDAFLLVDFIPSFKESVKLSHTFPELNSNLIKVDNGIVSWCFKGTKDECNNSLFYTYNLHEQEHPNPIKRLVKRNKEDKLIRTYRGLLSYFSRTDERVNVKKALKSSSFEDKQSLLKSLNIENTLNNPKKGSNVDILKFFAFQLGQCSALLFNDKELFTKNSVSSFYPDLKTFLMREKSDVSILNDFYYDFLDKVENVILEQDGKYKILLQGCNTDFFTWDEKLQS